MKNALFRNKPWLFRTAIGIAVFSIAIRLLMHYEFDRSALLYVGIPFLASLFLIYVRNPDEPTSRRRVYLNRITDAFILMLGSSVVLFEGFVCVVMFMPIYLLVVLLSMMFGSHTDGQFKVHAFTVLIAASAFEGVTPSLSFDRYEQITVSRIVDLSVAEIKGNLVKPIEIDKNRPVFLKLFPMPYEVKAGSLRAGDVHEIRFRYYRWFFTNLHEGRMLLEISDVQDDLITTTFLENDSYIANYIDLKGTQIKLDTLTSGQTQISLTFNYERILDPYWYFAPIQHYAISKTAEFLIAEVIARDGYGS